MPPIRPVKSFDLFVSKHVSCPPITVTNTTNKIVASPLLANTCILLKLWPLSPSHMKQENNVSLKQDKHNMISELGFFFPIFSFMWTFVQAHKLYELGKFVITLLILGNMLQHVSFINKHRFTTHIIILENNNWHTTKNFAALLVIKLVNCNIR